MAKRKQNQTTKSDQTKVEDTKAEETKTEGGEPTEGQADQGTENTETVETTTTTEDKPEGTDGQASEQETTATEDKTQEETKPAEDKPEPAAALSSNSRVASVQSSLDDYATKMAPNFPVTEDAIRSNQIRLKNVINTIMSSDDEVFEEVMTAAIKRVRSNRTGAFSDVMVYRGFPSLRIRQEERKRFEMLLQLMLAAADSKTTKQISDKVDLSVILRYINNDAQQNRLQSFFS